MTINPTVRLMLTILITILIIGGFAAVSIWGLVLTWQSQDQPATFSDQYVYIATALAGLVGGLVAAGFGQRLPESDASRAAAGEPPQGRMASRVAGLGRVVFPTDKKTWQQIVASIYAIVYILVGVATIITWAMKGDACPLLVKNMATVSFGLFLAIARGFFTEN